MPYKDPDKQREYQQRYYKENREKLLARMRRDRTKNPEKNRERVRRWNKENPDKRRAKRKQWLKMNPEKRRSYVARRRARRVSATIGDRAAIEKREKEIRIASWCNECEAKVDDIHVDHIQPLSKGGAHSVDNLQGLCAYHNTRKGNKT